MSFLYVATPFARYPKGTAPAFRDAAVQAGLIALAGIPIFCPITHAFPLQQFGGLTSRDHDYWMAFDRPFMDAAAGLIVVKMASWDLSSGVAYEIDVFREAGKPIFYMEIDVVPDDVIMQFAKR